MIAFAVQAASENKGQLRRSEVCWKFPDAIGWPSTADSYKWNEKGRAMRVLRAFFVIAAALMLAGLCLGETATYTETITASGTVGNSSFTNELVTLTATGDTSNIFELNNSPGTATFSANVASPAPEPSSLVLSASGALGMVAVLRRRFR
jgi:hypothetical protein